MNTELLNFVASILSILSVIIVLDKYMYATKDTKNFNGYTLIPEMFYIGNAMAFMGIMLPLQDFGSIMAICGGIFALISSFWTAIENNGHLLIFEREYNTDWIFSVSGKNILKVKSLEGTIYLSSRHENVDKLRKQIKNANGRRQQAHYLDRQSEQVYSHRYP